MDIFSEFLNCLSSDGTLNESSIYKTYQILESLNPKDVDTKENYIKLSNTFSTLGSGVGFQDNLLIEIFKILTVLFFKTRSTDLGDLLIESFTSLEIEKLMRVKKAIGSIVLTKGIQELQEIELPKVDFNCMTYDESIFQGISLERLILQLMSIFIAKCEDNKLWLVNNRKDLDLRVIGQRLLHRDFACRFLSGLFISRFSVSGDTDESKHQNGIRLQLFIDFSKFETRLTMQILKADRIFSTCVANTVHAYEGLFSSGSNIDSTIATLVLEPRDLIVYRKGFALLQIPWTSVTTIDKIEKVKSLKIITEVSSLDEFVFQCKDGDKFDELFSTSEEIMNKLLPAIIVSPKLTLRNRSIIQIKEGESKLPNTSKQSSQNLPHLDDEMAYQRFEDQVIDKSVCDDECTNTEKTPSSNIPADVKDSLSADDYAYDTKRKTQIEDLEEDQNKSKIASKDGTNIKEINPVPEFSDENVINQTRPAKKTPVQRRKDGKFAKSTKRKKQKSLKPDTENQESSVKNKKAKSNVNLQCSPKTPICKINDETLKPPTIANIAGHKQMNHLTSENIETPVPVQNGNWYNGVKHETATDIFTTCHDGNNSLKSSVWKELLKEKHWKQESKPQLTGNSRQIDLSTFVKQANTPNITSLLDGTCSSPPNNECFNGKEPDSSSSTLISDRQELEYRNLNAETVKLEEIPYNKFFKTVEKNEAYNPSSKSATIDGLQRYTSMIGNQIYEGILQNEKELRSKLEAYHINCNKVIKEFSKRQTARYKIIEKELAQIEVNLVSQIDSLMFK